MLRDVMQTTHKQTWRNQEIKTKPHTNTHTLPWHLASPPHIHIIKTMAGSRAVDSTWPCCDPSLTRPSDLCRPASTHPPSVWGWTDGRRLDLIFWRYSGDILILRLHSSLWTDSAGLVHRKCNLLPAMLILKTWGWATNDVTHSAKTNFTSIKKVMTAEGKDPMATCCYSFFLFLDWLSSVWLINDQDHIHIFQLLDN